MNAVTTPPDAPVPDDTIRVLHVDDDRAFVDLSAEMLEREDDVEVLTAHDGRAGLERLRDTHVDCIVSDFEMPEADGLEFLEAVRDRHDDLPFVLFTGRGSEAVASRAFAAGATDYLRKRTGVEQFEVLVNRVRNVVSQHRAARTVTRQAQAMEAATEGIAIVDADGRYVALNRAYTDVFGETREALRGRPWTSTVPDEEAAALRDAARPALCADGEWCGEVSGRRADGGTFPMRVSLGRLDGGGHVCVVRDLSDRRDRRRRLEDERSRRTVLFERATNPVVEVRFEDEPVIEAVNEAFTTAFGVEDVAGETIADVIVPDEEHADHEAIARRVMDGETVRTEVRRRTTDGVRDFLLQVDPFERADGTTTAYGRYIDITARKDRERQLEAERAFLDGAVDVLQDVFYVIDVDGTMRRWNDRLTEVTGYDDDEIAEMNALEFFPESHRDRVGEAIDDALASGEATVEADFLTADGESFPYEFTGTRLTDGDGNVRGLVGTGRDVSHHRRYERTLSAVHSATVRFMDAPDRETVIEHAVDTTRRVIDLPVCSVWLHDADADLLRPAAWTEEAEALVGEVPIYDDGDALSWRAFESGEMHVYDDLQTEPDAYNPEGPIESEIILPLGRHGVMNIGSAEREAFDYMDLSLARILANVLRAGLERVDRERELRDRRERLERQNRRLEEFASILSHDLRNPLTVAKGHVELLADGGPGAGDAAAAVDALDRMESLIDDVLGFARAGEAVTDPEAVSLADAVSTCWEPVAMAEASLTVESDLRVRADASRLQQLLGNLLRNCVEHGGSNVSVTVGTLPDGFYVADDGPGIPASEREAVMAYGHSTAEDGSGFGLRSVERVVEAHDWDLAVTTSEAGGARFEVTGVDAV